MTEIKKDEFCEVSGAKLDTKEPSDLRQWTDFVDANMKMIVAALIQFEARITELEAKGE